MKRVFDLIVNVNHSEVIHVKNNNKIISKKLSDFFNVILQHPRMNLEALFLSVFGYKYNSSIHYTKIMALLSEARLLLGSELSLLTKDGKVFLSGPTHKILLYQVSVWGQEIEASNYYHEMIESFAHKRNIKNKNSSEILLNSFQKHEFTRKDIQSFYQVSKTVAQKNIQKWILSGVIQSSGRGPKTKYLVRQKNSLHSN
jgi:hypothetical protein